MGIIYVEGGGYTPETHIDPAPFEITVGTGSKADAPLAGELAGKTVIVAPAIMGVGTPQSGEAPASSGIGAGVIDSSPTAIQIQSRTIPPAPLGFSIAAHILYPSPLSKEEGLRSRGIALLAGVLTGRSTIPAPFAQTIEHTTQGDAEQALATLEVTTPLEVIAPESLSVGGGVKGDSAPATLEVESGESVVIVVDIASSVIAGARGDNC